MWMNTSHFQSRRPASMSSTCLVGIGAQPVGEGTSGGAAADDHVVIHRIIVPPGSAGIVPRCGPGVGEPVGAVLVDAITGETIGSRRALHDVAVGTRVISP